MAEEFDPAFENVELVDADGADFSGVNNANTELFADYGSAQDVTLEYEVTVPSDAALGTEYEISSATDSDVDVGTDVLTVEEPANASVTFEDQDQEIPVDSVLVQEAVSGQDGEFLGIWTESNGSPDELIGTTQEFGEGVEVDVDELSDTQTLIAAVHPADANGNADTGTILASDTGVVTPVDSDEGQSNTDRVNTYWQGQIVSFSGDFTAGDDYQVREVDGSGDNREVGSLAREVRSTSDGQLLVRTSLLNEGLFVIEDNNNRLSSGDPLPQDLETYDGYGFEIAVQSLTIDDVDSTVVTGNTVNIGEVQSERSSYDLNYDIVHENGTSVQSGQFSDIGDFEEDLTFPANVAPDEYTLEFDVDDTTASAEFDLTVNARPDAEVAFNSDSYVQNRGDIATINMTAQGVDSYWVKIGDLEGVGYEASVEIAPDDDDSEYVDINLNTFVAGADNRLGVDVGPEDAISIDGGSIVNYNGQMNVTRENEEPVPRVLDPEVYALEAYDTAANPSNLSDSELAGQEYDVASLNLQESSVNELTAWTSPFDTDAMANLTVSDEIAMQADSGNRADDAVHEINMEGVYGALDFIENNQGNGVIGNNLDNDTQIFEEALETNLIGYDYRQLNPEANRGPKRIGNYIGHGATGQTGDGINAFRTTVDDGALTADIDAADKTIFVTLDNGGATMYQGTVGNTVDVEVGDQYQISSNWGQTLEDAFSEEDINEFETEDQVTGEQEILDRTAQFDGTRLDNGDLFIYAEPVENATISGTTTVADNTEMRLRLTSPDADAALLETQVVEVQNGTFSTDFDFSDVEVGTNITLTLPAQGFTNPDNAETDGQIIDPEEAFFEVDNLNPASATIDQGDSVSVSATVTNTGGQEDTQTVEFTVGGSVVDSAEVTLAPGESEDVALSASSGATSDLDGEYTHAISSNDATAEGTLMVNAPQEATFTVDALNPQEATATVGDEVQVSATVANEGDLEGTATVDLTLGGESVTSQDVTLAGGDFQTVTFTVDTSDLEAGDYEHGVAVGDESVTGTLTLEAAATPTPTPTETDTPTDTPEDSDGSGPGFGVAAALVALLGAALLAARRRA